MTFPSLVLTGNARTKNLPLPSNPTRGFSSHAVAAEFAASYPIGTELSNYAFDDWAERRGLLPPVSDQDRNNKDSDGWNARLMRRTALRKKINKAADHPRMEEEGLPCYRIVCLGGQALYVSSVFKAFVKDDTADRISSHFKTRRKYLRYLLESTDWANFPVETKVRISIALEQIDQYKEKLTLEAQHFQHAFTQIRDELLALAKPGSPMEGSEEHQLLQVEFVPQLTEEAEAA